MMHEIDFAARPFDVFSMFHDRWALATAGTPDDFNTLTIAWGSLGVLWNRNVATVYVSPARYTWEYLEKNDLFTVCFFPADCRKDLAYLGSHSGRDEDKVAHTSLTPVEMDGTVAFAQAELTLVCKKLYAAPFELAQTPKDMQDRLYTEIPPHHFFIGEIVKVLASDGSEVQPCD